MSKCLHTCCVSWPALGCLSSVYFYRLLGASVYTLISYHNTTLGSNLSESTSDFTTAKKWNPSESIHFMSMEFWGRKRLDYRKEESERGNLHSLCLADACIWVVKQVTQKTSENQFLHLQHSPCTFIGNLYIIILEVSFNILCCNNGNYNFF